MPNFTDGIQYINSSGIGSYLDAGVLISSGDLNAFYGANYWNRQFYAVGGNTLINTPVTGQGFSLEILRAGDRTTVQRIINITSISGASVPVMWVRSTTLTGEGDTSPVWSAWTALGQMGAPVENFGGTGVNVQTLPELIQVLDEIFKGTKAVEGRIESKNGFYVAGV